MQPSNYRQIIAHAEILFSLPLRQDALALEVKKRVQLSESSHGDRIASSGGFEHVRENLRRHGKRGVGGSVGGKVVTRPA